MTHVHLIGIGGTGLSAIARVLLERGEQVSGSDRQLSPLAVALQQAGVRVFADHHAANIQGADLVVRSSAIPDDNIEVQAARAAGLAVLKRADFLATLTQGFRVIAVAGTHGKTTTTSMIAWMLHSAGFDPSYIIGSVAANLASNAHAGKGGYFVIEADEYDRMFLGLAPFLAVVTNVEHDHPDCYPTAELFYQAFVDFSERIVPEGSLLVCQDDGNARRLGAQAQAEGKQVHTYGLNHWLGETGPQYQARNPRPNARGGFDFEFVAPDGQAVAVSLEAPGLHNASNALAALVVAHLLGVPLQQAAQSLSQFKGSERRFELRGEAGGVAVIDDYAHHPTEIRATLAAARVRYAGRPVWALWQPHTYSRTRTLQAEFARAFSAADHVLVSAIYAARENPPADGFSAAQVVAAMDHPSAHYIPELSQAVEYLLAHLRPGDVVLVLSAGDADRASARLFEELQNRAPVIGGRRSEGNGG